MVCAKKCPAVTAGLLGLLALPQTAQAATMFGMSEEMLTNTVAPFAFGTLAGAAVAAGIVHLIMAHRLASVESDLLMQRIEMSRYAELIDQATKVGIAPVAIAAGEENVPAPEIDAVVDEEIVEAPADETASVDGSPSHDDMVDLDEPVFAGKHAKSRHMAPAASVKTIDPTPANKTVVEASPKRGKRFKKDASIAEIAAQPDYSPEYTGNVRSPKHVRMDWEHTGNIRIASFEDNLISDDVADDFSSVPEPAAQMIEEAPAKTVEASGMRVEAVAEAPKQQAPSEAVKPRANAQREEPKAPERTTSSDYADVATNSVERMSFAQRMATRAMGVARVLQERIGTSLMEGVPVIRRADGTTGDVGTIWWDVITGEDQSTRPGLTDLMTDGFEAISVPTGIAVPAEPASVPVASAPVADKESRERSESIATRVASVQQDLYPEVRDADDVKAEKDAWEAALAALDRNTSLQISAQQVTFEDDLGGVDTLDEPTGLEGDTAFLPFKIVANHPEVNNVESYVDYLIADELSQNSSSFMRRKSPRVLRVIEGGSQEMRRLESPSQVLPVIEGGSQVLPKVKRVRGKHFKEPVYDAAREA
ncbi:MAG: hypothetical protein IJH87_02190 [Atopobiaceae bacterium]|nr:hypothetical protein [Atopobiaceae bacterium]